MAESHPCVFCWTPAVHSRPDEFHNKQERVECSRCGTYRLDERTSQLLWELIGPIVNAGTRASPLPVSMSNLIRRCFEESGHREVVIDDWEAFGADTRRLEFETHG